MGLSFDRATYDHYRDDVWANGFLPKVNKLRALQDKFSFTMGDQMAAYAKSWQGTSSTLPYTRLSQYEKSTAQLYAFSCENSI